MREQNKPQAVENARKKIAQLGDATDRGDLNHRYAVATGWLAALRLEGLVDSTTFAALSAELNAAHGEIGATLPLTRLEQTIIERARERLADIRAFYAKAKAGTTEKDDLENYRSDHEGLYALLEFGHLRDSGISAEGRAALLAVEDDAATALRDYNA